jgi:hypothetical protein
MALRIRLEWYDKSTDLGLGEELSNIIEDNDFVFTTLGLTDEYQIFDGGYNVLREWISLLQSYFTHPIDTARHDYQIAFRLPRYTTTKERIQKIFRITPCAELHFQTKKYETSHAACEL